MDMQKKYRIFISAAEPSADLHCAGLVRALLRTCDDIDIVGVGGPEMAEAGCRLLETTIGRAAMIYNAFVHIHHFYKLIKRMREYLSQNRVDLVIVCDSPSFNFHIARAAKKLGVKTLFYVAPQLWAWGSWRIRKLRKCCDKLCCILPFEQDWFTDRGVDTVFVGNSLLESIPVDLSDCKRSYNDFDADSARFALMPGSRNAEINSLWQPMQWIALRLKARYPGSSFVTVAVDQERKQMLARRRVEGFDCDFVIGDVACAAHQADFAIVASGSATLQVAAVGCPMVVMYKTHRLLWHLVGRFLVRTKHLSLVNLLARRSLVPEFMPYFTSIDPIVRTIEDFIDNPGKLSQINAELLELIGPLREQKASENVAAIVREMLTQTG